MTGEKQKFKKLSCILKNQYFKDSHSNVTNLRRLYMAECCRLALIRDIEEFYKNVDKNKKSETLKFKNNLEKIQSIEKLNKDYVFSGEKYTTHETDQVNKDTERAVKDFYNHVKDFRGVLKKQTGFFRSKLTDTSVFATKENIELLEELEKWLKTMMSYSNWVRKVRIEKYIISEEFKNVEKIKSKLEINSRNDKKQKFLSILESCRKKFAEKGMMLRFDDLLKIINCKISKQDAEHIIGDIGNFYKKIREEIKRKHVK